MYRWNQIFIASHKTFFILIGTFGNLNLLYIIFSTPKLRNKSSYLQSVQSATHVICVFNSFIDIYLLLTDTKISRRIGFHITFPVVLCFFAQAGMMFSILLDILLNLLQPLRLRNVPDWKYVIAMSIGPFSGGALVVLLAFHSLDDDLIFMCNPPTVLPQFVRELTFHAIAIVNTASLLLFIIVILTFQRKVKNRRYCAKAMSHLKVSAALFIVSTYVSTTAPSFLTLLGFSGEYFHNLSANFSISAMFSYSHTFYAIIWRSSDYRSRFISIYSKKSTVEHLAAPP